MVHPLHMETRMRIESAGLALLFVVAIGCKGSSEAPTTRPSTVEAPSTPAENSAKTETQTKDESTGMGFSGRHRDDPTNSWVPAEYKSGMARFKDPGVYADGVLVGMLKFGEIPVPLEPIWFEEEASLEFKAGDKGPRTKIVKQRRYRFTDYFEAIGVDVAKIKEFHIYGGNKRRAAALIPGDTLRSQKDEFTFRFGGDVWGKPIPSCPTKALQSKCPDQLTAVTIYLEREPPIRKGNDFFLNGEPIYHIPYYGEPIRGGVRVYLDGRLVTTIKRRKLTDESIAVQSPDGEEQWKFVEFLKSQGVATDGVQEAWLINQNRRVKRIGVDELNNATFTAIAQRSGVILFGEAKTPIQALALHTKPVKEEDLPVILPHEG